MTKKTWYWVAFVPIASCSSTSNPPSTTADSGSALDAGKGVDGGVDAGIDAGPSIDAGTGIDAGPALLMTRLSSRAPVGQSHRPEIMVTNQGDIVLLVVQPDPGPTDAGTVKHRGYRFDANWNPRFDAGFAVTWVDPLYGEPADHRASIVNNEIVVIYQTLIFDGGAPTGGGASESYALSQSLMLARFDLDGGQLFRGPIVLKATDFTQDSFPDHCHVWRGDRLIVSTGSTGSTAKIREVALDAGILATYTFTTPTSGFDTSIGNSFFLKDGGVMMFSHTSLTGTAALSLVSFNNAMQPTSLGEFSSNARQRDFPTGSIQVGGFTIAGYISRSPKDAGYASLDLYPYEPYLLILDPSQNIIFDISVGDAGMAHVHPTLARSNNRLFVAWSRRVAADGGQFNPEVNVAEYALYADGGP